MAGSVVQGECAPTGNVKPTKLGSWNSFARDQADHSLCLVAGNGGRQINLNSMNWPGHKSLLTGCSYMVSSSCCYVWFLFLCNSNVFSYCLLLLLSTFSKMFIGGLSWQTSPGKREKDRGTNIPFIYLLSQVDWTPRCFLAWGRRTERLLDLHATTYEHAILYCQ